MKIRVVKWKNHPILGCLELDFTNRDTSNAYDTVVLAGENGVGKTSILESISTFLNNGSFKHFEYIEYETRGKILRAIASDIQHDNYYKIQDNNDFIAVNSDNGNTDGSEYNPLNIRYDGCVFSKARADFKTEKIQYTTTIQLDSGKSDIDNEDNFTSLKQLIVDVENQDNAEYSETNKLLGNNPKTWNDFQQTSKLFRFSSAFDGFFDKIKYERVADVNGEKVILFKKNNNSISLDKLSTGEKQIVFRGIYLLRNLSHVNNGIIMIDEPELSMHPKWQRSIFKYYRDLFSQSGQINAQIFFSTHSEYVVNSALLNKSESIVVILNEDSGVINPRRIDAPSILPTITNAETNFLAFDIVTNDYHIELYGYMQQKFSLGSIKTADEFIENHGSYNSAFHNKVSVHPNGRTNYNTLPTFIRNLIDHPDTTQNFNENQLRVSIELLRDICS